MKTYLPSTLVLALLVIFGSCQKEVLTKPVAFTETSYSYLGTYDTYGTPNYLLERDVVSPDMLTFINTMIPDQSDLRKTHPELLGSSAIADIRITKAADVYLTYVSHGAGESNAIAFYTYPSNSAPASAKDIDIITYANPSASSKTKLEAGDKVLLGHFEPGTSIGFVLMQAAWDGTTQRLNNDAVHFCSNDVLNPEVDVNLKKHAVLIPYPAENKMLIGFEDLDRTNEKCDHDFNDVVVYATIVPTP
jgi:hypothetical protein